MTTQETNWILRLTDKVSGPLAGMTQAMGRLGNSFGSIQKQFDSLGQAAQRVNNLGMAMQSTGAAIDGFMTPAVALDASMKDVQAITGSSAKEMDTLKHKALELSTAFGGPASQQMESFGTLLSKLGPEVMQDQAALGQMLETTNKLALTMKGDTNGAMRVLTASVNVFGNANWTAAQKAEYMYRASAVMSKAAQDGSVEVSEMAETLDKAAAAAKMAGIDIEELGSLAQVLGTLNIKGSEGGTALSNFLSKTLAPEAMSKDAVERLRLLGVNMKLVNDSAIPLGQRLQELSKIRADKGAMMMVFGNEAGNLGAGAAILNNIDLYEKYNASVRTGNALEEQAAIYKDSLAVKIAAMNAQIDALKIGVIDVTGEYASWLAVGGQLLPAIGQSLPVLAALTNGVVLLQERIGKTYTLETDYLPAPLHEALAIALSHDFVELYDPATRTWQPFLLTGDYSPDWPDNLHPTAPATAQLTHARYDVRNAYA